MKYLKYLITFIIILSLSHNQSLASEASLDQESTSSSKIETTNRRTNIEEKIQELKDNTATEQAKRKTKLTEQVREKVQARYLLTSDRMHAALERMKNIGNRIQSRLKILSDKGVETQSLTDQLEENIGALTEAEEEITNADNNFKNLVLDTENPAEGYTQIKTSIKTFLDNIKSIHRQFTDIVIQMKVKSAKTTETEDDQTSTPDSTNQQNEITTETNATKN